jgi:hypothetical protein
VGLVGFSYLGRAVSVFEIHDVGFCRFESEKKKKKV